MHEARIRARARELPRAFRDELTRADGDDATAQAAVAGLVVLRVVDRWVAQGCRSGFDVAGARAAVVAAAPGEPTNGLLQQVLDAVGGADPGGAAAVADRLLQYGRALELDAKWALALAVYDAIVSHAGVGSPARAVAYALTRQGYCHRTTGAFDASRSAYARAQQLAEQEDDLKTSLLAELGHALTDAAQGVITEAEEICRRVGKRARRAGLRDVESRALHERAVLAGNGGDPMAAAQLLYAALQLCDLSPERDRILDDIGESLRRLGVRDAARDAFLVLSATARDQISRWMALIRLMRIAGDDGLAEQFRNYRCVLESEALPMRLAIELELQSGYALRSLGRVEPSRRAFRRAIVLARTHGHTPELLEAERASAGASDCVEEAPADAAPLSEIVASLRAMREAAEAD